MLMTNIVDQGEVQFIKSHSIYSLGAVRGFHGCGWPNAARSALPDHSSDTLFKVRHIKRLRQDLHALV